MHQSQISQKLKRVTTRTVIPYLIKREIEFPIDSFREKRLYSYMSDSSVSANAERQDLRFMLIAEKIIDSDPEKNQNYV